MAERLNRWLPDNAAYTAVRWKNVLRQTTLYRLCQKWPHRMRKILLSYVERQLPEGYDVEKHFGPRYNPWDQRLCLVPNGDLFRAIRNGQGRRGHRHHRPVHRRPASGSTRAANCRPTSSSPQRD